MPKLPGQRYVHWYANRIPEGARCGCTEEDVWRLAWEMKELG